MLRALRHAVPKVYDTEYHHALDRQIRYRRCCAERLSSTDSDPAGGSVAAATRLVVTEADRPLYLTPGAKTEGWSQFLLPGLIALAMIGAMFGIMVAPSLL